MASKPAPGELELVRELVNTLEIDGETRTEELRSPEMLATWLEDRGLVPRGARLGEYDFGRALELREAFDRIAADAKLSVRVGSDGRAHLEPTGSGLEGAIGRIAAIVYQSEVEGTWSRLKACSADDCQWAFYDSSRNRSGTWCDMASCGNRAKVRAYRERAAAPASKRKER
jgi:hypothetical protein